MSLLSALIKSPSITVCEILCNSAEIYGNYAVNGKLRGVARNSAARRIVWSLLFRLLPVKNI